MAFGSTIAAAAGVFVGTNLDDIIVLTILFLAARADGRARPWQIWVGHYLGIVALVAVSLAAAFGLRSVPEHWIGLLGLLPFTLGTWGLFNAARGRTEHEGRSPEATGVGSVIAVTIANGGDNISVYAPMFRVSGMRGSLLSIATFVALATVWCLAGSWLGSHPKIIAVVSRYGHWIVPAVFIVIGATILVGSGVLARS